MTKRLRRVRSKVIFFSLIEAVAKLRARWSQRGTGQMRDMLVLYI